MKSASPPEHRLAVECLAGRIRILNRVVTGLYDDALRPHGLRVTQMNVLVAIAMMGPIPSAAICRRLRLEKSTLSRDLGRLVERGWVRMTPGGGRTQQLEITDRGRKLLQTVTPAWEDAQSQVRRMLGPSLIKQLIAAVDGDRMSDSENC